MRSQSESTQVMAAKKWKYQDDYLQFGFVNICIRAVEKPQCVICQKVLGADSQTESTLRESSSNLSG